MRSTRELKAMVIKRLLSSVVIMGCLFFLPAGTLSYWEAWVFIVVLFGPMLLAFRYLIRSDPELLERRLNMHEKEESQKSLMKIALIIFIAAFLLPGFDHRFGWSNVPMAIILFADGIFLIGYALFFRVLKENSYASRTVEVTEGQQVISTGPYSIVRHPMYVTVFVMYIAAQLALGSWWGFGLLALYMTLFLRYRILDEEKVLLRDLPGYGDYMQRVRWRLIPHVW